MNGNSSAFQFFNYSIAIVRRCVIYGNDFIVTCVVILLAYRCQALLNIFLSVMKRDNDRKLHRYYSSVVFALYVGSPNLDRISFDISV